MPNVELPKELQEDFKAAEESADPTESEVDNLAMRAEPVVTAAAWAAHEKDYGAKLPPSVVEFEEEESARPEGQVGEQHLPADRWALIKSRATDSETCLNR